MRILVVGSGGREHALCRAIAASPLCEALFCAPGNAGIARQAQCVPIGAEDLDGLVAFARREAIGLVVIGPEELKSGHFGLKNMASGEQKSMSKDELLGILRPQD